MVTVTCPFCEMECHTSCPEALADCAHCGKPFAESRTEYQRLVILGRDVEGVWDVAERLSARWQEDGDLESEVIVDRRLSGEAHAGEERRRISAAAASVH